MSCENLLAVVVFQIITIDKYGAHLSYVNLEVLYFDCSKIFKIMKCTLG
jgi:hypothetical protein